MRYCLLLPLLAVLFSGCSEANDKMTVEEKVMTNAFAGFVSAGTYDSVCGGKKLSVTDAKKNPAFALYMGNRQLFGARMGALWKARHPEGTPEQGLVSLIQTERSIAAKIAATLKEKGCDSAEGQDGKRMFELYSQAHPAKINAMLDQSIVKDGGKVTPPPTPEKKAGKDDDGAGKSAPAAAKQ